MKQNKKKNLFFPLTIEEVEEMDRLDPEPQDIDEDLNRYMLFSNDWYDTISGQNFLFFPNHHRDDT
jgi:hypothetical protein